MSHVGLGQQTVRISDCRKEKKLRKDCRQVCACVWIEQNPPTAVCRITQINFNQVVYCRRNNQRAISMNLSQSVRTAYLAFRPTTRSVVQPIVVRVRAARAHVLNSTDDSDVQIIYTGRKYYFFNSIKFVNILYDVCS